MKNLIKKLKKEETQKKILVGFFIFLFVAGTFGSMLLYFI